MPYTLPYGRTDKNTISCNAALSACEEGGVWGDAPAFLSSNASERIDKKHHLIQRCSHHQVRNLTAILRVLDGECNPSQAHTTYINLDGIICVALSSFVCEWSAYANLRVESRQEAAGCCHAGLCFRERSCEFCSVNAIRVKRIRNTSTWMA